MKKFAIILLLLLPTFAFTQNVPTVSVSAPKGSVSYYDGYQWKGIPQSVAKYNLSTGKLELYQVGTAGVATVTATYAIAGTASVTTANIGNLVALPSTSTPTTTTGTVWFCDTDKHIYVWNGTAWVQLDN